MTTTTAPVTLHPRTGRADAMLATLLERRRPGHSLEAPFYLSEEIFQADLEHIFRRHWIFVAVAPQVPEMPLNGPGAKPPPPKVTVEACVLVTVTGTMTCWPTSHLPKSMWRGVSWTRLSVPVPSNSSVKPWAEPETMTVIEVDAWNGVPPACGGRNV